MVDSIMANQASVVQKPVENRSITSSAVSNASNVPDSGLAEDIIDVTPRTMDSDPDQAFSGRGIQDLSPTGVDIIRSGEELRPPLENFRPVELTSEKALENRIADIEVRSNNDIDETDSEVRVNNEAIEAFRSVDQSIQQSVDLTA